MGSVITAMGFPVKGRLASGLLQGRSNPLLRLDLGHVLSQESGNLSHRLEQLQSDYGQAGLAVPKSHRAATPSRIARA
jgi:hypothetical protein